jgi:Glycosyltransferase
MKRKKRRKKGSIKRGLRNRTARGKRRKHSKLKKLSGKVRRGRKKRRGKKRSRLQKAKETAALSPIAAPPQISEEDLLRLRSNNAGVRAGLMEGSRIIEWFYPIFQLNSEDFVWEMFRQILQREPDSAGFYTMKNNIDTGMSKAEAVASLIRSEEAENVFRRKPSGDSNTAAYVLQSLLTIHELDFIHGIYMHLLYKLPDAERINRNIGSLRQGASRQALIAELVMSEDMMGIQMNGLPTAHPVMTERQSKQNIGIFLNFVTQVSLDGEGIGRFVFRLTEGLLSLSKGYILHIATTEINWKEIERSFGNLAAEYPGRIHLHHSDSMEVINRTVPADTWIVPYVGMGLAQYLHKPYIVCLHDLVYLHFPEIYQQDMGHFQYVHSVAETTTAKAAMVVFNSEFIRNYEGLTFLKLPVHKTEVVRFAAPYEEYLSLGVIPENVFRSIYNLIGPYITFPSVARLHKNHHRLIDAFHRYRLTAQGRASGLKLVFTDEMDNRPSQPEITAALNAIVDPQIRASILFIGRIPSVHLPSLYKYAEGVIVPTLFEGSCPFPILESLLMDTPVSFGRLAVVQEVLADMSNFATFDPLDPLEMSSAIDRLMVNGKSVASVQKAALGNLLQRSWHHVAEDYSSIIERLT